MVAKFWEIAPEQARAEFRTLLPNIFLQEPEKLPRLSIAQAIGGIALLDLPHKRWPELIDFVSQCANSPSADNRECGVHLLGVLFETISEHYPEHLGGVFSTLTKCLSDPESLEVRILAVQGLSEFAEFIDSTQKDQVAAFQNIVPTVVNVFQETISQGDVKSAIKVLELFEAALLSESGLLNTCFNDLVVFMFRIATDQSVENDIRNGVLTFLYWTIEYRKSRVIKFGLVESYIRCGMTVAVEPEEEDIQEECPAKSAITMIGVLASTFPSQQIFSILGSIIIDYVRSDNEGKRKAGLLAIAVAAEGCSEFLSAQVDEIIPLITATLGDSSPIVRRASCFALYSLADEIHDDVTKYHGAILPHLLALITDQDPEVAKNVWNAIDSFMSEIGTEAAHYLPMLMQKSGDYLDSLSCQLKMAAIAAIGSAASSAEKEFIPYFPDFIDRLRIFMTIVSDNPDELTLRAIATDSAASVASAVGKNVIAPYIQDLMTIAFEGMSIKGPHLRDSAFSLFSTMSQILGTDFAAFLEPVMNQVRFTLDQSEFDANDDKSVDLESEGSGSEEVKARTDISDEKEVAISTTAELFRNVGKLFLPYLEPLTKEYIEFLDHYADGVRKTAFETLLSFAITLHSEFKMDDWVPGLPVQKPVNQVVANFIDAIMPSIMEKWNEEADSGVVNLLLIELDQAIQAVGPALIANHVEAIASNLQQIFRKQALCQLGDDYDEHAGTDDLAEQEAALIVNAADVLGAMTRAVGPDFFPLFRPFFPLLKKHFKSSQRESQRTMAVGVLGDIILGLGARISEYTLELLEIFLNGLSDPAPIVRSNSAFGVGILCASTAQDITSHYGSIFERLSPLFLNQPHNTTDNACGAVCRMIKAAPHACPIDLVIPAVINHLPLKEDAAENEPIYECLILLLRSEHSSVHAHIDKIKALFTEMINNTPDHISSALRAEVKAILG
ncbi:hypothetical protein DSO57_1014018 [Entomophthora muscae]|uniref:Uncharacterized protein n=1 Tax=Entomophthora muscae TaxID=34485 RepID=A0ACC2T5K6_9FUNG|nr:hypothetical protein DSO57_1014018 [Entomophthora muscae]